MSKWLKSFTLKSLTYKLNSENDTLQLAKALAETIKPGVTLFLKGNLGAGKTTFVRYFLKALQYPGKVKSPTFTLVEPYEFSWGFVYHFDLYRLSHPEELDFIGIREYFLPTTIVLVEWPEQGGEVLPPPDLLFDFEIVDITNNKRQIVIQAVSESGREIIDTLKSVTLKNDSADAK